MTNELQIFNYAEEHQIRTMLIDGAVWFVAKDVCDVLGYTNARKALSDHLEDDERSSVTISYGTSPKGGNPNMNVINESGLYCLILRSNKPQAKKFRKWVTSEVLPSIRQTGMYVTTQAIARLEEEVRELRAKVEEMYPINVLGNTVLAQKGAISFKDGATFLSQHGVEIGQNRLFRYCREQKLLCSRKGNQWNRPTQRAIDKGLFNLEISGGFKPVVMITPKGLQYLSNQFIKEEYPLLCLMMPEEYGEVETRD